MRVRPVAAVLPVVTAGLLLVAAPPAGATPVAVFTATPDRVLQNQPVVFDAGASTCDVAPCRYLWRWYRPATTTSTDLVGTPMGEGRTLTYSWPRKGVKIVVLKVVNATTTHAFSTAQTAIRVHR